MTEKIKFKFREGKEWCTNLILGLVTKAKLKWQKAPEQEPLFSLTIAFSQHHTNESDLPRMAI
jgi:hypothetical protein